MDGWRGATWNAAIAEAVLLAIAAIGLRDPEAGAMAVGAIIAIALLRVRSGLLGLVGLVLLSANVALWMAPGAISNLAHGEGFWETVLPSLLATAAVTTLACALGALVLRRSETVRSPRPVLIAGAVAAIVLIVVAAIGPGDAVVAQASDIELTTEKVRFSDDSIEADAGEISVFVSNKDLFWHTFTVGDLDVNVTVPVGAERRATFEARPGTYGFVCAIPGHTQAGMKGTLTVR